MTKHVSPITTISPYYMPPHMHNVDLESNFEDFEYDRALDGEQANIWWQFSLKRCILKSKKNFNMLCNAIM